MDAITCGGAISGTGASITTLSATNLSSGTVNVNRLGSSGTRNSSTFLRGDNTWAVPSGGGGGSGTVTSVATSTGLQGGTITTSGTLSVTDSVCMGIKKNSSSTNVVPSNKFFDFGEGTGISMAFAANYPNKIIFSTGTRL